MPGLSARPGPLTRIGAVALQTDRLSAESSALPVTDLAKSKPFTRQYPFTLAARTRNDIGVLLVVHTVSTRHALSGAWIFLAITHRALDALASSIGHRSVPLTRNLA